MKKEFIIESFPAGDRYIFITKINNKVTNIDFYQGLDTYYADECEDIFLRKDRTTPSEIVNIYNNLNKYGHPYIKHFANLSEIDQVNEAIEIYIIAYLF
jgi:hypothetical protein